MLMQSPNPLMPAGYDLLWTLILVVIVVLAVTAVAQVLRTRSLRGIDAVLWVLVILVVPVLGSLLWFLVGRPKHAEATPGG